MADTTGTGHRSRANPIQPEIDAEPREALFSNREPDFEPPSEISRLLSQRNIEPNDEGVNGNRPPGDGSAAEEDWQRQLHAILPALYFTAAVMSIEGGYSMATNTTHVGEDLNEMDKAVWTILAGSFASSWVPPFLPFLSRKFGQRWSMILGTGFMAVGVILPGLGRHMLLIAASRALGGFGSGLVRLLSFLIIKNTVPQDRDYSLYRANLVMWATVGRICGSPGGLFIDWLKSKGLDNPWRVPYLIIGMLILVVLRVLWGTDFPESKSDQSGAEDSKSRSWQQTTKDLSHPVLIACGGFMPLVIISVLRKYGFNSLVSACFVLTPIFVLASIRIEWNAEPPIFPARAIVTWPIGLVVLARAAMIFAAQPVSNILETKVLTTSELILGQIDWRLPFFAKVRAFDRNPDWALPLVFVGQAIGEYAAGMAIKFTGSEPICLGTSLFVFFCIDLLLGKGFIGQSHMLKIT